MSLHCGAVVSPSAASALVASSAAATSNSTGPTCLFKPVNPSHEPSSADLGSGAGGLERNKLLRVLRPTVAPSSGDRRNSISLSSAGGEATAAITNAADQVPKTRLTLSPELRLPTVSECQARIETDDCVYLVCKPELVMGRETGHSRVDVGFRESYVSRQHARLTLGADGWRLKCLSKNGINVNDKQCSCDAGDFLLPSECVLGFPSTSITMHFSTKLTQYLPCTKSKKPASCELSSSTSATQSHPDDPVLNSTVQPVTVANFEQNESCDSFTDKSNVTASFDSALMDNVDADESFDGAESTCSDHQNAEGGREAGKPPYSYSNLIVQAIASSAERRMTLSGIYSYIMSRYAYYRTCDKGWQNSIRHNLSLNRNFERAARSQDEPGKGSFWFIKPEFEERMVAEAFKERRRGKSSSICSGPVTSLPGLVVQQSAPTPVSVAAMPAHLATDILNFQSAMVAASANWTGGLSGDRSATSSSSDLSSLSPYSPNYCLAPSTLHHNINGGCGGSFDSVPQNPIPLVSSSSVISTHHHHTYNNNMSQQSDGASIALKNISVPYTGECSSKSLVIPEKALPIIKVEHTCDSPTPLMTSSIITVEKLSSRLVNPSGSTAIGQNPMGYLPSVMTSSLLPFDRPMTSPNPGTLRLPVVPEQYEHPIRLFDLANSNNRNSLMMAGGSVGLQHSMPLQNDRHRTIIDAQLKGCLTRQILSNTNGPIRGASESAPVSPMSQVGDKTRLPVITSMYDKPESGSSRDADHFAAPFIFGQNLMIGSSHHHQISLINNSNANANNATSPPTNANANGSASGGVAAAPPPQRRPSHDDNRQRLRICFSPPEITPVPTKDTSALKHLTRRNQVSNGAASRHRHGSGYRTMPPTSASANGLTRGGTKSLSTTPVRDMLAVHDRERERHQRLSQQEQACGSNSLSKMPSTSEVANRGTVASLTGQSTPRPATSLTSSPLSNAASGAHSSAAAKRPSSSSNYLDQIKLRHYTSGGRSGGFAASSVRHPPTSRSVPSVVGDYQSLGGGGATSPLVAGSGGGRGGQWPMTNHHAAAAANAMGVGAELAALLAARNHAMQQQQQRFNTAAAALNAGLVPANLAANLLFSAGVQQDQQNASLNFNALLSQLPLLAAASNSNNNSAISTPGPGGLYSPPEPMLQNFLNPLFLQHLPSLNNSNILNHGGGAFIDPASLSQLLLSAASLHQAPPPTNHQSPSSSLYGASVAASSNLPALAEALALRNVGQQQAQQQTKRPLSPASMLQYANDGYGSNSSKMMKRD